MTLDRKHANLIAVRSAVYANCRICSDDLECGVNSGGIGLGLALIPGLQAEKIDCLEIFLSVIGEINVHLRAIHPDRVLQVACFEGRQGSVANGGEQFRCRRLRGA